jgi:hypothetical protein
MKIGRFLCAAGVAAFLAAPAMAATGIDISVVRASDNCETEYPQNVVFEIRGTLNGDASDGLAAIGFDLSATLDGVAFDVTGATVSDPADLSMDTFVRDDGANRFKGVSNPAGYKGTPIGNKLVQIGGAQDTIGNGGLVAPFPEGPVVTGIGNTEQVLAVVSMTLTTPPSPGQSYVFTVDNVFGNVIDTGQAGPVYTVSALDPPAGSATIAFQTFCFGDLDGNRSVNGADRGQITSQFGCDTGASCACAAADLDGNGAVNGADRGQVTSNFGPCDP